ncbi:alpha/beta fold hydrolase [Nonomuraea polychroma]|uniref:alpha/beta fold hydrolase n=1 Tax=Nonomuraea polychroma TaxID=46176 RepID=UPI003D8D8488
MRVEVNGIGLEVQVSGEGPVVLLVHGYPDTHALWRHQVVALNAAGYRTIAPDLRGFGASCKPQDVADYDLALHVADLLGILDHFDVRRAHLVGHDWGATLAQLTAIAAPARVTSLACLSVGHPGSVGSAGLEQREKSWYFLLFQFLGIAEEWLSRDDFTNMRDWLSTHPEPDEVIDRMRDPRALTAGLAIYRKGVPPEMLLGRPTDVPPIPVPTMGVWSGGDRYLTEESMTGTAEHVTGSWRYERLDGIGHWMPLEAPEEVNRLLLDFLSLQQSRPAAG